jgi:hypothetical protein
VSSTWPGVQSSLKSKALDPWRSLVKIVIRANVGAAALLACSSALACGAVGYRAGGLHLAAVLLSIAVIGMAAAHKAGSAG